MFNFLFENKSLVILLEKNIKINKNILQKRYEVFALNATAL